MNKQFIFTGLILILSIFGCEKTEYTLNSENGPKVSNVIWFDYMESTILVADSVSYIDIPISLNKLADDAFKNVIFSTDLGVFANGSNSIIIETNSYRNGIATLYAGDKEGVAHIRAMVDSISIDTSLRFIKALPDYMLFSPGVILTEKENVKVDLTLKREVGKVGEDIIVQIQYKSLDTVVGILDVQSSIMVQSGNDSVTVSNPFNLKGRFEVVAKSQNQELDSISVSTIIVFK